MRMYHAVQRHPAITQALGQRWVRPGVRPASRQHSWSCVLGRVGSGRLAIAPATGALLRQCSAAATAAGAAPWELVSSSGLDLGLLHGRANHVLQLALVGCTVGAREGRQPWCQNYLATSVTLAHAAEAAQGFPPVCVASSHDNADHCAWAGRSLGSCPAAALPIPRAQHHTSLPHLRSSRCPPAASPPPSCTEINTRAASQPGLAAPQSKQRLASNCRSTRRRQEVQVPTGSRCTCRDSMPHCDSGPSLRPSAHWSSLWAA